MSENALERVTQLAKQLPAEEKRQLIERLSQDLQRSEVSAARRQSLRGVWKDKFPEELISTLVTSGSGNRNLKF